MPKWSVQRMLGLSIPIPNALVATNTVDLFSLNSFALSLFSTSHSTLLVPFGAEPEKIVTGTKMFF